MMKLRVTSCNGVYNGTNQRGDPFTIYEVQACKEDGSVVERKLRSFEDLPLGELLDLSVTKYDSEKHGESFTLSRTNRPASGQRIDELATQVSDLSDRVQRLEQIAATQVQAGQTEAKREELDARFGESPPF